MAEDNKIFKDDEVWKDYAAVGEHNKYMIYEQPWYKDLKELIVNGGNLDEFIKAKDEKRHNDFIKTNSTISKKESEIKNWKEEISGFDNKCKNIENIQNKIKEMDKKIDDILAIVPKERHSELKYALIEMGSKGEIDEARVASLLKPKGFWDRLKNGKKYKNGQKQLLELKDMDRDVRGLLDDDLKRKVNIGDLYRRGGNDVKNIIQKTDEEKDRYERKIGECKYNIESGEKLINVVVNESKNIQLGQENQLIKDFVEKNGEKIKNPEIMTNEEVKEKGLSSEYIEGMILNSKCPRDVYRSIRQVYETLKEPAAPRMAFNGGRKVEPEKMVEELRKKGMDAVMSSDERAVDPNVFVVTEDSIHAPFLSPKEALKANIAMIEATNELGGTPALSNPMMRESMVEAVHSSNEGIHLDYYERNAIKNKDRMDNVIDGSLKEWESNKSMVNHLNGVLASVKDKNPALMGEIKNFIEENASKYGDLEKEENLEKFAKDILTEKKDVLKPYLYEEYRKDMIKEAEKDCVDPIKLDREVKEQIKRDGYPQSVFHGGQQGGNPYAVLCREGNMAQIYGAVCLCEGANYDMGLNGNGALGYAFGKSSHHLKENKIGGKKIGFLYEYESRKDKQEMTALDKASDFGGGKFNIDMVSGSFDETAVYPHQNKLKKVYLAIEDKGERKLFPMELDENGQIKDKKWRDFVEFHNPVDDNLKGFMVERRNNMIKDFDENGKDNMYRSIKDLNKENVVNSKLNVSEKSESVKPSLGLKIKEIAERGEMLREQGRSEHGNKGEVKETKLSAKDMLVSRNGRV